MKQELEKGLKRFLKRRISFSQSVLIAFLITGGLFGLSEIAQAQTVVTEEVDVNTRNYDSATQTGVSTQIVVDEHGYLQLKRIGLSNIQDPTSQNFNDRIDAWGPMDRDFRDVNLPNERQRALLIRVATERVVSNSQPNNVKDIKLATDYAFGGAVGTGVKPDDSPEDFELLRSSGAGINLTSTYVPGHYDFKNYLMHRPTDKVQIKNSAFTGGFDARGIQGSTVMGAFSYGERLSAVYGSGARGMDGGTAIGVGSYTAAGRAVALGRNATTTEDATLGTALGNSARSSGKAAVAVGAYSNASGENSIAIGSADFKAGEKFDLTNTVSASEKQSVAIGYKSRTTVEGGVALGANTLADREAEKKV